ncbi:MAG TPA: VOC family protein [Planctomycetota bacterium]|jgi:lactoylglutathione lyase|nr:VOC family protein [Planctomycetota bacterium]
MVSKLESITLWVSNMKRSLEFYRKMGILPRFISPDQEFASLQTKGAALQLHAGGKPHPRLLEAMHIDFAVDDVDKAYVRLRARGLKFKGVPEDRPWGERSAYLTDPDGFVLEISGPLKKRKQANRK